LDGRTHFFAVIGSDEQKAQELCMWWVRDIARSIRWVTESLFTHGTCFQTSSSSFSSQASRLMAGYLLHSEPGEKVRMIYVELQIPKSGKGRMALFEEIACRIAVDKETLIDARTPCYEKVGFDCSCFAVGTLQLSARTVFERQLWLRAVQNLKVKVQNRGPDPGRDELFQWRQSINEHIRENAGKLRNTLHIHDHKATSALHPDSDMMEPEAAVLMSTVEKLRGMPLLQRVEVAKRTIERGRHRL
jgi:hypothetical protein